MLTITANDVLDSTSYVGELLNDLKPIIFLLGGLYVAFYVISKIIELSKIESEYDKWFYDDTGLIEKPEGLGEYFSQEERDELSGQRWIQRFYRRNPEIKEQFDWEDKWAKLQPKPNISVQDYIDWEKEKEKNNN